MSFLDIFKNKEKSNEEIERDNNQIIKDFVKGGVNMAEEDFEEDEDEFVDDEEEVQQPIKKKVAPQAPARPMGRPRLEAKPQPAVPVRAKVSEEKPIIKSPIYQQAGWEFELSDGTKVDMNDLIVRMANKIDAIEKAVGA